MNFNFSANDHKVEVSPDAQHAHTIVKCTVKGSNPSQVATVLRTLADMLHQPDEAPAGQFLPPMTVKEARDLSDRMNLLLSQYADAHGKVLRAQWDLDLDAACAATRARATIRTALRRLQACIISGHWRHI